MSTVSVSTELNNLMSGYISQREAIQQNKDFSSEYQTRQVTKLFADTLPRAETVAKRLIGDATKDENERYILSESGAMWQEISNAEKALNNGKDRFIATRYNTPSLMEIYAMRVNSILRGCMSGHDFLKEYARMLSGDEKLYCQDNSAALFKGREGADWRRAEAQMAVERKTSENAVFTPLEEAVSTAVYNAGEYAVPAFKAAANEFGRTSWFFSQAGQGIHSQRVGMGYEVARVPWGVIFANRGKVTHYEMSTPWPAPKAKRV